MLNVLEQILESVSGLKVQVDENTEEIAAVKALADSKADGGLRLLHFAGTVDIDGVPSLLGGELLTTL